MVRLKVLKLIDIIHLVNQFQFQYGSIKSCFLDDITDGKIYFNSNMVRLKVWVRKRLWEPI